MNTEQINELRNLAQAATPGPWVVNGDPLVNEGAPHLMTEDGYAIADFWGNESSLGLKGNEQNAAFIATANPAAILALIQQRDEFLRIASDAATSLETINCRSFGDDSYLNHPDQMRAYAGSRAGVVRKEIRHALSLAPNAKVKGGRDE